MSATAFRRIDIDALEEDVIHPSDLYDPDPRGAAGMASDAKGKSAEVRSAVSRGDTAGALNTILTDCPYGEDAEEAKVSTTSSVFLILNSTRSTEISNLVKGLSGEQQDRLMAYLYKGMSNVGGTSEVSGSVLLSWHEKVRPSKEDTGQAAC